MGSKSPEKNANEVSVQKVEQEEMQNFRKVLEQLYLIWEAFGIESSHKAQRAKVVFNHVHSLLSDILDEERHFYEDVKERVQNYTTKVTELSRILLVPCKEVSGSLIKKEEFLRQELDLLTNLKNKRVKAYKEFKNEELMYCQILNIKEQQLPPVAGVPSEKDLYELEQQIILLRNEKQKRHVKFSSMKQELITILEITELTPESIIPKEILSPKENAPLSNETFKLLEEAISKAQAKKTELIALKKSLIDKLSNLWQRLKIEDDQRVEFLSKHNDCRLSTLNAIEQEVEKCEQIKKDNIKIFIESLKKELTRLWTKCYVSENQKHQFKFYSSSEMTDEVLNAFEAEVEKWKSYHKEVQHILDKINRRQELFDLMIEFENKPSDQNRFKNRGGNLLEEEKQRKKLQRDLPALEEKIFCDIEVFENKDNRSFLYFGEDYKAFVTRQWEDRIIQKENEKRERQKQHILRLQNEISVGTPLKRPLPTTPKSAPSKMFKSNHTPYSSPAVNYSNRTPNSALKVVSRNTKLNYSRPNAIKQRDQMILRERNRLTKNKLYNLSPNATTYTQFADELNTTARCSSRSSVLATKKPGGTRISMNNSPNKKKSVSKSLFKSPSKLTPARGKFGLPFLI